MNFLFPLGFIYFLCLFLGLYIFHNVFIEVVPFSFQSQFMKYFYFVFAYFGIIVFMGVWGASIYLMSSLLSIQFNSLLSFWCINICGIAILCCVALAVLEGLYYQFTLASLWEGNGVCFLISSCFLNLLCGIGICGAIYVSIINLWNGITCYQLIDFIYSFSSFIVFIWFVLFRLLMRSHQSVFIK